MGVIQRQAIKNTTINFFGVLLGAINVLFIYEQFLTVEEHGKMRYIISTSLMLSPFILLGATSVMVRFYPKLNERAQRNNELLTVGILALLAGGALYFLFSCLAWPWFPDKLKANFYIIYLIMVLLACSALFTAYLANFRRIAVPAIFNNILIKIGVPSGVLLYYAGYFDFASFEKTIALTYGLGLIGLLVYAFKIVGKLKPLSKGTITKDLRNDMSVYAIFAMLGGLGTTLATQLDIFMLSEIKDFDTSGIYSVALFLGTFLVVPVAAVNAIASPVISQAREKGDDRSIASIYRQSSIHLLVFGLLIALLLWINIDSIFSLMSKGDIYGKGKYVVLVLMLAKLIDMATSVNSQIIAHSLYFRFNFYSILLLAILNIVNNIYFINEYGMIGAAFATFISIACFNLAKFIFIWLKFKMQPFSMETIKLILVALGVYMLVVTILPDFENAIFSIVVTSLLITGLYVPLIYFLKISTDLNDKMFTFVKQLTHFFD